MPRFNEKALIVIRAEGITVYLVMLSKCGAFWIQMAFPVSANPPIAETVVFFYSSHAVGYGMGNHALQFADKASESLHRGNVHESSFLKHADMSGNRGEVMVKTGQPVIRSKFSSKMLPGQVCLLTGEFGQGCVHAQTWAWPVEVIARIQGRSGAKSKLGHYLPNGMLYYRFVW